MGAQEDPTPPVVVQLTDEQFERVFARLDQVVERIEVATVQAAESVASKVLTDAVLRLEARLLAIAKGSDILLDRNEVGRLLTVSGHTVDAERRAGKIEAAPFWKGRYSLNQILMTYGLFNAANDNDSAG